MINMTTARDVLTPDALSMLHTIAQHGSFAAAARTLNLVPSALTYRVRQIEDALDVLLFDRRSRQAKLTAAGQELLREGARLLADVDAIANRVKRVATGWESEFTVAIDSLIDRQTVMELCEAFFALSPPTRLRLRDETLTGTLAALTSGQADLAVGVVAEGTNVGGIHHDTLGPVAFVFAVAPHHPLAQAEQPLSDETIRQHRAVAVADSVQRGQGMTVGLLAGQDVFTVPSMGAKLEAQLRGLGAGFLPEPLAEPYLSAGRLVRRDVQRPRRVSTVSYAWRQDKGEDAAGRALKWWLQQLKSPATRAALLSQARRKRTKGVES
jgi:DNA-binding transcriptional LysR family regulator